MTKKSISSGNVQFQYNSSCPMAVTIIQFSESFTRFFEFSMKVSYWTLFVFQYLISCSVVSYSFRQFYVSFKLSRFFHENSKINRSIPNCPTFWAINCTENKYYLRFSKTSTKGRDPFAVKISKLWCNWHFLVQSQHQNNVWNLFKVNNKDTKMTTTMSFWCLYC